MANQKQPIDLIIAKGKKHLTKAEIEERKKSEVVAPSYNVQPPMYLPMELKKHFNLLAKQLLDIGIMANIDAEALAHYVMCEHEYQKIACVIVGTPVLDDSYSSLLTMKEKAFKQARSAANDLGLTISSRCKLSVPQKEEKIQSKFAKFGGTGG